MDRTRILRSLRITFSVLCLIVCGLLTLLWVRSYLRCDFAHCSLGYPRMLALDSMRGTVSIAGFRPVLSRTGVKLSGWGVESHSIDGIIQTKPIPSWTYAFDQYGGYVLFPHWFATLVAGTLAAILGIRRPYRFSLRTSHSQTLPPSPAVP